MKHKRSYLPGISAILFFFAQAVYPQTRENRLRFGVLDFGDSELGRRAADILFSNLKLAGEVDLVDRDLARAAMRGVGYAHSLNLSLKEARDLGVAIGCDFYLIGDAQTLRRSPSSGPIYFESYASTFLVSSRTGRLISWERPSFQGADSSASSKRLFEELERYEAGTRHLAAAAKARAEERKERELALENNPPIIEEAPDNDIALENQGLQLPRPYRRMRPDYPTAAVEAEAEAVVDVLADLDANGEVERVEVVRWAGFGLDEATVTTVRRLHFFPAMRNGTPIPIRVLLRYNFRKHGQDK